MALNWPPPAGTYPAWPPPEFAGGYEASGWQAMISAFREAGFTHDAMTGQERAQWNMNSVRCGDNHNVIGRVLVSPDGTRRYPFAACNSANDREFLVLWEPFTCGWMSAPVSF